MLNSTPHKEKICLVCRNTGITTAIGGTNPVPCFACRPEKEKREDAEKDRCDSCGHKMVKQENGIWIPDCEVECCQNGKMNELHDCAKQPTRSSQESAEDHKAKGYHSKSEMRRIETMKSAAETMCCDFDDDGKNLKPARNGEVLKICARHQSMFLKGNVPVAAEEGEELKHAEDCDGTVCTRCATDIVDRTRKEVTEEAWKAGLEILRGSVTCEVESGGHCQDCDTIAAFIQAAKDRGVNLEV